jgi:hypothetical protein
VPVGNILYNLLVFKYAATAARTGDLAIGPAEAGMTLLLRGNRRGDPFFDGFFGNVQRRPVVVKGDPVPMKVLPLPRNNVPDWFTGAVGQYAMQVTVGPTNLAVGDPITVSVRITGRGLLDGITLPEQPQWRDFKIYPASSSIQSEDPLGLVGAKVFEQVIIPQNHEIKVLPSVMFGYFDSGLRSYRTLSNAPVRLTVRHASQVTAAPPLLTNTTEQARPPEDDILHIRVRPDGAPPRRVPWIARLAYYAVLVLPLLGVLGLAAARRQREIWANNPRLRRCREVEARVGGLLDDMQEQAQAGDAQAMFASLFRILQEQLGERLDLPASAITEAVIDERLPARGVDTAVRSELHALFQACNQARYAPSGVPEELAEWLPRLEAVLPALRAMKS